MKKYDTLYKNGKIFTSDDHNLYAESMAVKDGKIAWIGKNGQIDESDAAEIVDLDGRRVLPGFVDCHMHAIMLADCCQQISALPPSGSGVSAVTPAISSALLLTAHT